MSQMWGERLPSSAWHVVEKYGILYATSVLTKWASFKYTVAFPLFMEVHLHGLPNTIIHFGMHCNAVGQLGANIHYLI